MLLDLVVAELEYLQFVWESRLGSLCLSKEVDNFAIREGLFDVLVVKIDDSVSIWEWFTLNAIVEDDLFLTVLVDPLYFAIVANVLLHYLLVG